MVYVAPDVVYVLYKGDEPIGTGTPDELEATTGISAHKVRYYATPSAQARALSIRDGVNSLLAVRVRVEELEQR